MSTVTPNLGLVLPSNSEKVSRVIINTNNERIDAAFGTAGAKVYTVELAVSNVSGAYEGRVDDDVITAQMSANRLYIVDPSVFNDVITVTCYDGYLTLACDDVAGNTTVEITVIKEAVDPTQITSTEFDILNNRIGDLSTLDTTNKSNVVNAVNEVKAGVDTNSDAIANIAQGEAITFTIDSGASSLFSLVKNASRRYGNLGVYNLRVHTLTSVSAGERQLGSVNRSPSGACCGAIVLTSNTSQVGTFSISGSNVWINITTQVAEGRDIILSASCDCAT